MTIQDIGIFVFAVNTVHLFIILALTWSFLKRLPLQERLLHPFGWFSYLYASSVVLRLYSLGFGWSQPMVELSWRWAVIYGYAFTFFLVFYFASIYFTFRSSVSIYSISRRKWMRPKYAPRKEYMVLTTLLGIYFMAFFANYVTGGFQSFGDVRTVQVGNLGILINISLGLLYFILGLSFFLYMRDQKIILISIIFAVIATMILTSILSGGRGILLMGVFILCMFTFVQPKLNRIAIVTVPIAVLVVTGILVTVLRMSGDVFEQQLSVDDAIRELGEASERLEYGEAYGLKSTMIDRFSYHPDTWIIMNEMRWGGGGVPRGFYPLGSFSDIYMFIPRFLWSGKPYTRFNFWMGHIIQNRPILPGLDYPVTKIGEAYYVLDVLGVIFAVFLAFVFHLMYRYLRMNPNIIVQSVYFLFLMRIVIQGNGNFMAGVDGSMKTLVLISPFLIASEFIFSEGRKARSLFCSARA